ncbi:type II secretion system protein GspJ [Phycisphaera mikurensis]|uniref:Type II secretion system protein J n=1 Tax=Phycisphaera mikurensis (strain NBRC 102666 / KCTC 22515 / FYK2301M01) TaxID=1142394 RepID=I0IE69_PHYMF|nr:type II secretion system protein GspJ [Phycisphaera mikurensis]MBB6441359.1 prepilin-type N-terminal cleavage/methylation domain-containing protein [Phycisphaera mikurensis]BAM03557.1 hypothetical protein PSMK_13980 [Phycisphaera mikurensis NBRC 102666]
MSGVGRRAGRAGFTLVELLVVAVVGAVVVGAAAAFFAQAAAARERVDAAVEVGAEADAALAAVVDAVRGAVRPVAGAGPPASLEDDPGGVRFELEPGGEGAGDAAASRLTLNAWSAEPVRPGRAESDWQETELYLEADGEDPLAPPSLKRRRDPTLRAVEAGEPGGVVETVAAGVVGFSVRVFDGEDWQEAWPPVEDPRPRLPEAVRVSLTVVGSDGRSVSRERLIGGLR